MSIRKVRILFLVSIILSLFVLTVPVCHAQDKTGATDRETNDRIEQLSQSYDSPVADRVFNDEIDL